ncbi:hypothetical protein AGMMS50276_17030 [Synergistales bacterium]|nr:hypothetical protein AGMMS50276_17030 [Synergistales bacterium]
MGNDILQNVPLKKNAVRVRAALIVIAVCFAGSLFAVSVGIYFSTHEITNTVANNLTLLGKISSGMVLSSIDKIKQDTEYVGMMMDRARSGGIEELTSALENEAKYGPSFISLGVVFPDGLVISKEKENRAYAALSEAESQRYLETAPREGIHLADSVVTASGERLIRCYLRISGDAVFISTLPGDYFARLLSISEYGAYDSGRAFILDGQGSVIAGSTKGSESLLGLNLVDTPGELGDIVRRALFGKDTESVVVQYDDKIVNAGRIICSYTPLIRQNERWVLFVTVPVSGTSIPQMRALFVISGLIFFMFGAVASIFLSAMQVKPYEELDRQNILLSELKVEAELAGRAKGDFLSNMSHEIRTPLNAVIGMTAVAKSAKDEKRRYECLTKIEGASRHLMGVINDILDMSKIEANKLELDRTDFNFKDMIVRVSDIVAFRVEEKHQSYSIDIDALLPSYINSDEQRLAQVITNLLTNAVKFTPENGDIHIAARLIERSRGVVETEAAGTEVAEIEVSVKDSGIGISEEQQAKLFTSFQQADSSTSRKYGGTGLGLAISKRIVEMMDGRIWVESEPGQGSRFSFRIRAAVAETPEAADLSDSKILDGGGQDVFEGKCVLLAEDVEINREIVHYLLEPAIRIIDAVDGLDAVQKFTAEPEKYDIIFMDVQMPELDGYDATRQIRALGTYKAKSVPIIAMTANVFKEDVDKCLAAGMDAHIGKPIDIEQVLEKLRVYLE